jgi:hypothetical protein
MKPMTSGRKLTQVLNSVGSVLVHQETADSVGMEFGSVTLKINNQHTLRPRATL